MDKIRKAVPTLEKTPEWAQGLKRPALMTTAGKDLVLEALLWAWTNLNGRLPDENTMSEAEIQDYWEQYGEIVRSAIHSRTGMEPDDYLRHAASAL